MLSIALLIVLSILFRTSFNLYLSYWLLFPKYLLKENVRCILQPNKTIKSSYLISFQALWEFFCLTKSQIHHRESFSHPSIEAFIFALPPPTSCWKEPNQRGWGWVKLIAWKMMVYSSANSVQFVIGICWCSV